MKIRGQQDGCWVGKGTLNSDGSSFICKILIMEGGNQFLQQVHRYQYIYSHGIINQDHSEKGVWGAGMCASKSAPNPETGGGGGGGGGVPHLGGRVLT